MTHRDNFASLSTGADYAELAGRFRPLFTRIAEGALERERSRTLPSEPIKWLKEAGFGAVRVPVEHGGAGASLPQLVRLLTELAAADSNLPQALRGHFAFVEDRLNAAADARQDVWFKRFVAGEIVGNAWTEVGEVKIGDVITKVSRKGDKWVVNGAKFYSTGSIFADWIDVYARRSDDNADVIAAVRVDQPGVRQQDDWDGFGQRTTGSGTSTFEDALVEPENIIDFSTRFKYQTAFYQLVHLATLAGIGRAVERDVAQQVAARRRIFSHGNAPLVRNDPQIQQVVGEIDDEHDTEDENLWTEDEPGVWQVQARAMLDDLRQALGADLREATGDDDVDTLGGLVYLLVGRVPARGEVVAHPAGHEIEVLDADPRRVKRLRLRLKGGVEAPAPSDPAD